LNAVAKNLRDKHRAVDAGLSLSGWVAAIIVKELSGSRAKKSPSLSDSLGNEKLAEFEIEFSRNPSLAHPAEFV
jgi:hypothetical protein